MEIDKLDIRSFRREKINLLLSKHFFEEIYFQKLKSSLNIQEIINLKIDKIKKYLEMNSNIWQITDKSKEIIAIFGLEKNEFRSKNFRFNYFQFNPLFNPTERATEVLAYFEEEVLQKEVLISKIQYLKAKVDALDYNNIASLCNNNYVFIGTSLNLIRESYKPHFVLPERFQIKENAEDYIPQIRSLLLQHYNNEDFYDVNVSISKTRHNFWVWLYSFYLTKDVRLKHNTNIILLYDNIENEVLGFSCYSKEGEFSKSLGLNLITRDITVVNDKHSNKGYGSILFNEIMQRENKNVELKLMSNNYKAINFNLKNRFTCVRSDHYFRKIF